MPPLYHNAFSVSTSVSLLFSTWADCCGSRTTFQVALFASRLLGMFIRSTYHVEFKPGSFGESFLIKSLTLIIDDNHAKLHVIPLRKSCHISFNVVVVPSI